MSAETDPGRWWENYLVRYFMPSIAGIGIVAWLIHFEPALRPILFFEQVPGALDAPTLTLLILYGNLFCYVASFPILCFHATRVLDFREHRWLHTKTDGYLLSAVATFFIFLATVSLSGAVSAFAIFLIVGIYSVLQLTRFIGVFRRLDIQIDQEGNSSKSLAYVYALMLARRRNTHLTLTRNARNEPSSNKKAEPIEMRWRKEFTDTYRHMREHGNSAFIFVLEFTLATATFAILRIWPGNPSKSLCLIGGLLVLWSIPAIGVHLLAQSLERRFSLFDDELTKDGQ